MMIVFMMILAFTAICAIASYLAFFLDQEIDKRFMEEFGELFE